MRIARRRPIGIAAPTPRDTSETLAAQLHKSLAPEQQRRISAAVVTRLQQQLAVSFREDPQLLSGLRLSLGPWHLNLNFADELAGFAAAANHVDG